MAAYQLEQRAQLGATGTVLSVAVPVAAYVFGLFGLYAQLIRSFDPFHVSLLLGTAVLVAAPVVLAGSGVSLAWCLTVLSLAPWVTVVGYELRGHRHDAVVLHRLHREAEEPHGALR